MSGAAEETTARCHCGAITLTLQQRPREITECNCSLCRSTGVRWAYLPRSELGILPAAGLTDSYAWNGRHVDFHRCRTCGCVTHWVPRDAGREQRGVNANLLPQEVFAAARLRHRDGAGSGDYTD